MWVHAKHAAHVLVKPLVLRNASASIWLDVWLKAAVVYSVWADQCLNLDFWNHSTFFNSCNLICDSQAAGAGLPVPPRHLSVDLLMDKSDLFARLSCQFHLVLHPGWMEQWELRSCQECTGSVRTEKLALHLMFSPCIARIDFLTVSWAAVQ